MGWLIVGLLIWVFVHFFPALAVGAREKIIHKIGEGPYKGIFALLILSSVILIVVGWRSIEPVDIYYPQSWGRHITFLLVLLTFILFAAARSKTNIKRFLRHPQLTGLVLWSIGHLFANGDNRSLLLFTSLGVWAILEMLMINRREGAWQKPAPFPIKNDIITVIAGCVVYVVLFALHPYFTGMRLV